MALRAMWRTSRSLRVLVRAACSMVFVLGWGLFGGALAMGLMGSENPRLTGIGIVVMLVGASLVALTAPTPSETSRVFREPQGTCAGAGIRQGT